MTNDEPNKVKDRVACPECCAEIGQECHGSEGQDMEHTYPLKRGHRARMEADRVRRGKEGST